MPGAQLLLLLPLLAVPIAWLYARLPRESLSRAGAQVLLLFSTASRLRSCFELVPVRQEADGSSGLLQWMSPTWQLWSEAPGYVVGGRRRRAARVTVWLAAFAASLRGFLAPSSSSAGRAALAATACCRCSSVALVSATSVEITESTRRFDVERRVLFPPAGDVRSGRAAHSGSLQCALHRQPGELPPLFTASAVPGERTDPQPVRVLLNARFRLPAGKYAVDSPVPRRPAGFRTRRWRCRSAAKAVRSKPGRWCSAAASAASASSSFRSTPSSSDSAEQGRSSRQLPSSA